MRRKDYLALCPRCGAEFVAVAPDDIGCPVCRQPGNRIVAKLKVAHANLANVMEQYPSMCPPAFVDALAELDAEIAWVQSHQEAGPVTATAEEAVAFFAGLHEAMSRTVFYVARRLDPHQTATFQPPPKEMP